MPAKQSFFEQLNTRLVESQQERLKTATYLYNHYGEPSQPLTDKTAHWFAPSHRANFTAFKGWTDFSDDAASLLVKPYVWSALSAFEAQKFFLCIPAALAQVVKLSPTGVANKIVDMAEALVASVLLAIHATLEFYMQVASLVIRTGITGLKAVGVDLSQDKEPTTPSFEL